MINFIASKNIVAIYQRSLAIKNYMQFQGKKDISDVDKILFKMCDKYNLKNTHLR